MLSHANLCYQVNNLQHFLAVAPGQRTLSLLPPWHIYERACGCGGQAGGWAGGCGAVGRSSLLHVGLPPLPHYYLILEMPPRVRPAA